MELSSTKFTQGIKEGKYTGWDDPKLPTIASLKNKVISQKHFGNLQNTLVFQRMIKLLIEKNFLDYWIVLDN